VFILQASMHVTLRGGNLPSLALTTFVESKCLPDAISPRPPQAPGQQRSFATDFYSCEEVGESSQTTAPMRGLTG
jgi:hypothetical protein